MTTVRLDIEYDGSRFNGWARQPGLRTVQGDLEAALATVLRAEVELTAAGRTDAGVHALGQVASFDTAAEVPRDLARRLNGVGPRDLAVTAARVTRDGFDARRDARSRTYRYRLLARSAPSPFEQRRALWVPHPLDREALSACAAMLAGVHDFTAFTPTQTEHVHFERTVMGAEWLRESEGPPRLGPLGGSPSESEDAGDLFSFEITADAFLRNMVRVLVGTMLEVGTGRRTAADFGRLLDGATRPEAGETVPPHGLYLIGVDYPQTAL